MARRRVVLVLLLAVAAGGVLAFSTYNYVQKAQVRTVSIPTRPVVVAAADLDLGTSLTRDDIRIVDWPANAVPPDAISDPNKVIGRGLVLPVIQNEPILPPKLAAKGEGAGLPPAIPPGLRAVSVRVNDVIGVAGYVLPGTHVDVVATVSPNDKQADMTSKVILTNVEVLAAGTKIEQDAERNKPMPVSVVTLLVTPSEAERLTLASVQGKIQLALRNPLDKGTPNTAGIRPAVLLGLAPVRHRPSMSVVHRRTKAKVRAADPPPPPPPPTVEIIRGAKRTHEVVPQEHQP